MCSPSSPYPDEMSVGFVYTFEVSDPREKESFYLTVPPDDVSLTFKFDLRSNPDNRDVVVQLFLGKSESSLSLSLPTFTCKTSEDTHT